MNEPLLSPFAASFAACILSARKHAQIMASILKNCPGSTHNWWFIPCSHLHSFPNKSPCYGDLVNAYNASVIQAAALLRHPISIMADDIP